MAGPLGELVRCWMAWGGIEPAWLPTRPCWKPGSPDGRIPAGPAPILGRSATGRSGTAIACRPAFGPG